MKAQRWFLLGLSMMALGACGGSGSGGGNPDGGGGGPCVGSMCGRTCTSDSSCGVGYHCDEDSTCTAECTQGGSECGAGRFCDDRGYCRDGAPPPDGSVGECPNIQVRTRPVRLTVQFLIDHSGTMNQNFGGQPRVDAVRDALLDEGSGVIARLESEVSIGATLYTGDEREPTRPCPDLRISVPPALDNYDAIDDTLRPVLDVDELGDDTPTGESLLQLAETFPPPADDEKQIIILATDGEPDTCADPDPQNAEDPDERAQREQAARDVSEGAAQDIFQQQGIEIYVLSVGNDITENHLQRLANAGIGKALDDPNGATVYRANDEAALVEAFDDILSGARECRFTLDGTVTDPTGGTVTLNGVELEYLTDWTILGGRTLELLGAACQTYLSTPTVDLEAEFTCDSVIDVPIE